MSPCGEENHSALIVRHSHSKWERAGIDRGLLGSVHCCHKTGMALSVTFRRKSRWIFSERGGRARVRSGKKCYGCGQGVAEDRRPEYVIVLATLNISHRHVKVISLSHSTLYRIHMLGSCV